MIQQNVSSNQDQNMDDNPFDYANPIVEPGKAVYRSSVVANIVNSVIRREYVSLLAPRQTGKTTLLGQLLSELAHKLNSPNVKYISLKDVFDNASQNIFDRFVECVNLPYQLDDNITSIGFTGAFKAFLDWLDDQNAFVFLVDEVPKKPDSTFGLILAMRAYRHEQLFRGQEQHSHVFVIAGSQDLGDLTLDINPYLSPFNIATEIMLPDFTENETTEFIKRAGDGQISASHGRAIYAVTQGHPFLVQYVSHHLWCMSMVDRGRLLADVQALLKELNLEGTVNIQGMMSRLAGDAGGPQTELQFLRRILKGERFAFALSHRLVRNLLMQGCIKESNGLCAIRNPIYEAAFWNYFRVHDKTDEGRAQETRRYSDFVARLTNFDGWFGVTIRKGGRDVEYDKAENLYLLEKDSQYELRVIMASGLRDQQALLSGVTQDLLIQDGEEATDRVEYTIRLDAFYNFEFGEEQTRSLPPGTSDVIETCRFPLATHEATKAPVKLFVNVYQGTSLIQVLRLQIQIKNLDAS